MLRQGRRHLCGTAAGAGLQACARSGQQAAQRQGRGGGSSGGRGSGRQPRGSWGRGTQLAQHGGESRGMPRRGR